MLQIEEHVSLIKHSSCLRLASVKQVKKPLYFHFIFYKLVSKSKASLVTFTGQQLWWNPTLNYLSSLPL